MVINFQNIKFVYSNLLIPKLTDYIAPKLLAYP